MTPWERIRLQCRRPSSHPGREDPLEEEMATPLQYSYLGNPTDRGASGHKELDTPELLTLFSLVDQEREQF